VHPKQSVADKQQRCITWPSWISYNIDMRNNHTCAAAAAALLSMLLLLLLLPG
jgi:hypothetical protein